MTERKILVCDCHSLEHQIAFWYDEEDDVLYLEPHLTTHRNFFQRLYYGVLYAFGHKSRFGAWDEMLVKPEELTKILNELKPTT